MVAATSHTNDQQRSGLDSCRSQVSELMPTSETHTARAEEGATVQYPYTEHPPREGKVDCAVVLDASWDVFSRRVVGSIDASPTAGLVTNALGMAIQPRTPPAGAIIHSDQGV